MRYTILEELRALDIDGIKDRAQEGALVGRFLRNAEKTFKKISTEAVKKDQERYTNSTPADKILESNVAQMLDSEAVVTQDDFTKIEKICRDTAGVSEYDYKASTINCIFLVYAQAIVDEALGALNCFTSDFNGEKTNINKLKGHYTGKALAIKKDTNKKLTEEINQLFRTLKIDTLGDLIPKVDQMIAEKLTEPSDSEHAGENQSPSNKNLDALAKLADQLVINAEIRKNTYPRERIVAARLRLSINMQRIRPIERTVFLAKLKPQLKKAKACFKSSRSRWTVFGRRMSTLGIIGSAMGVVAALGAIAAVAVLFAVAPPVAAIIVGSVAVAVLATTAVVESGVAVGAIGALHAGYKPDARSAARERPVKAIEKILLAMKDLDDKLFDKQFQSQESPEASVGEGQPKRISDDDITSLTKDLHSTIEDGKKVESPLVNATKAADKIVARVREKSGNDARKAVTIEIEDGPPIDKSTGPMLA